MSVVLGSPYLDVGCQTLYTMHSGETVVVLLALLNMSVKEIVNRSACRHKKGKSYFNLKYRISHKA